MKLYLSLPLAFLLLTAPASALELGIQDSAAPLEQRNDWAASIGAAWERVIVVPDQADAAQQIRDSHAAGRKVILTIGGLGTRSRHQNFPQALRFIATLPAVERYTISNEPDLDGWKPCAYRKAWMAARRTLGERLLWGDFSPMKGLRFTLQARKCGSLPHPLDFAAHPYYASDPLAPNSESWELGIGNLPRARRALTAAGIAVNWWLTEDGFGERYAGNCINDDVAAVLWPRALTMARRIQAKVLVIYTAKGVTWDTRPGPMAWAAIRSSL